MNTFALRLFSHTTMSFCSLRRYVFHPKICSEETNILSFFPPPACVFWLAVTCCCLKIASNIVIVQILLSCRARQATIHHHNQRHRNHIYFSGSQTIISHFFFFTCKTGYTQKCSAHLGVRIQMSFIAFRVITVLICGISHVRITGVRQGQAGGLHKEEEKKKETCIWGGMLPRKSKLGDR